MRSATRLKIGKDPAYLRWLHTLPCVCCEAWKGREPFRCHALQLSPTEAAHVGTRGLSQKCPDREAIPLCADCHRLGKYSLHSMGVKFWFHHDLFKDQIVKELNELYDSTLGAHEVIL